MSVYGVSLSSKNPFWFASHEVLTHLLRAEVHSVDLLFANYPDLSEFFDIPEATIEQRTVCFAVLVHRALMHEIYETFAGRQEQSPSLGEEEKDVLQRTRALFDSDAPAWVLETNEVAERLPARICDALPEPLRAGGYGFARNNPERMQAIESAKNGLSRVEDLDVLIKLVLDQQLQRLQGRWAAPRPLVVQGSSPKKRKRTRTQDKLSVRRDKMIAEIDDISPTTVEYLKNMDERNVTPQPTWSGWPGSWVKAYKDPRLRKLIHQDKSRALARVRGDRRR